MTAPSVEDSLDTRRFSVGESEAGMRLDAFLSARFGEEASRSRLKALIEDGAVTVDGGRIRVPKHKVRPGSTVAVNIPEPAEADPVAEPIPLDILFEDDDLVVLNKPAGLIVHPGAGHPSGTLVNALLHHCGTSLSGVGGVRRPGIVHRLDKDTSGVMVAAKNDRAHRGLAEQFAAHGRDGRLYRAYQALIWGAPQRDCGMIDAPLGRSDSDRTRRKVVKEERGDARHAVTRWRVLARFGTAEPLTALVECELETGRTHQIRVHMAHLGHPLVGDPVYGGGFRTKALRLEPRDAERVGAFRRQALHAHRLRFIHPGTGQPLDFHAPPPPDLAELIGIFAVYSASDGDRKAAEAIMQP